MTGAADLGETRWIEDWREIAPVLHPDYDAEAAMAEGWGLSYAEGNADGTTWQLQRIDDMGVFQNDSEAHVHVARRAFEGSLNHRRAINFLERYEPYEYSVVMSAARCAGLHV